MPLPHLKCANLLLEPDDTRPLLLEQTFIFLAGGIVEGIAYLELLAKSSGARRKFGNIEVGDDSFVAGKMCQTEFDIATASSLLTAPQLACS